MTFSARSASSLLRNFEKNKFCLVSIAEKMKDNMALFYNSNVWEMEEEKVISYGKQES